MPTETGTIDLKAQKAGRDDAAQTAERFITDVNNDGIWVHPNGAGPSSGSPVSTTSGWHISDVLEYWKGITSWFKLWLDTTANKMKMRLGSETSGHTILDDSGMEVFDGDTSISAFGKTGARIGATNAAHVDIKNDSMSLLTENNTEVFSVNMNAPSIQYDTYGDMPFNHFNDSVLGSGKSFSANFSLDVSDVVAGSSIAIYGSFATVRVDAPFTFAGNTFTANGIKVSNGTKYVVASTSSNITFTKGTASSVSRSTGASGSITINDTANNRSSGNIGFSIALVYDGGNTISVEIEFTIAAGDSAFSCNAYGTIGGIRIYATRTMATPTFTSGTRRGSEVGSFSSTFGIGLIAKDYQTVVGTYNAYDSSGNYRFVVGNGTDSDPSNAFAVTRSGEVDASTYRLENGSLVSDTATNNIHMTTPNAGTSQAVYSIENSGKIYVRTRTRTSESASWGSWSSWTNLGITAGSVSVEAKANAYTDVSISFGNTYSSAPTVVVGFYSTSTAAAFGGLTVAVHSITTTGCKARVFNNTSSGRSPSVHWIAVGS